MLGNQMFLQIGNFLKGFAATDAHVSFTLFGFIVETHKQITFYRKIWYFFVLVSSWGLNEDFLQWVDFWFFDGSLWRVRGVLVVDIEGYFFEFWFLVVLALFDVVMQVDFLSG